MAKSFHRMDMLMMMNKQWRLLASFFCLSLLTPAMAAQTPAATPAAQPAATATIPAGLKPFIAKYQVLRSGKVHGDAERYLKPWGQGFELGYKSNISWLIFKDERHERSRFVLKDGRLQPFFYQLKRWGTGSGRHYELNLDWSKRELLTGKEKTPKQVTWNDQWLDQLSYHSQLVVELAAGQTEFNFTVLSRHGDSRTYQYKVTGEELLSLPAGKLKTIRIERVGKNLDKQVVAWVAPELDYLLVKLWQAEDKVEQFDVQLQSYQLIN
jgi:hypothetical protein